MTNPTTPTPTTAAQALALAAELRELSSKTTSGTWRAISGHHEICEVVVDNPTHADDEYSYLRIGIDCGFGLQASDNQDFIVFARNNAAHIATTLDALAAENAKLREALTDMVGQHCTWDGELDDGALSANQDALLLLEQLGVVRELRHGRYEFTPQEPAS